MKRLTERKSYINYVLANQKINGLKTCESTRKKKKNRNGNTSEPVQPGGGNLLVSNVCTIWRCSL